MARRGTGRWVARAAATGGGRTYRGHRPVRWYASLALIVLVGLALIVYSRYEREHPAPSTQPAIGIHWYSAIAFDICGKTQPDLSSNPNLSSVGITTDGDGVVHTAPTKSSEAGNNATLKLFAKSYPGFVLTPTELKLPGGHAYHNGETCPVGTPQAHKTADVFIQVWSSATGAGSNHPVTVTDPSNIKLANWQLITVAFDPLGTGVAKPTRDSIATMQTLISGVTSSTTTTTPSSSTTAPTPTTTAPSSTTTTTPSSTTTTS